MKALNTVIADKFTNGILDSEKEMLGPLKSGGRIIAHTAPGCWGPMLTPELRGGHEVTVPVYVEGAEPGDAVAIYIESVVVTSDASSSGTDVAVEGNYISDPFVADKCPVCNELYPTSEVKGTGVKSIVCKNCGTPVSAFEMSNGYTMVLDQERKVGVTVTKDASEKIAKDAWNAMKIPENSVQNPVVLMQKSDIAGAATRLRPFIGQLGTTPEILFPDSHNAGDFGQFLIGAEHDYAKTKEELEKRTDGHMDINKVRPGAVVICPVKVKGAGIYVGDVHGMQGEGEIAGHTLDVSAVSVLRIELIKGLNVEGPVLLPVIEDLPYLAKPLSKEEKDSAILLAAAYGMKEIEESVPVSFVGTGENLNAAIENGLGRAAGLLDMSVEEVKNRTTFSGAIEIGRAPGVVTVTLRVPVSSVKHSRFAEILIQKYLG